MPKKVIVIGAGDSGRAAAYTVLKTLGKNSVLLIDRGVKKPDEIETLCNSEVTEVVPEDKLIRVKSKNGPLNIRYDRLIVATGSDPHIPIHLRRNNVYPAKSAKPYLLRGEVVFYGLGIYGLTLLKSTKKNIIVIEPESEILKGVLDPDLGQKLRISLSNRGIKFFLGERIKSVYGYEKISGVETETGFKPVDTLIVDIGIIPRSHILAKNAELGLYKGLLTNEFQETSLTGVYACGSCAEVLDASIGIERPIPTTDVSNASGIVAGYNASGRRIPVLGYVRKIAVDIFGLGMVSVGITEEEAKKYGLSYHVLEASQNSLSVKIVLENGTDRLLGIQALGPNSLMLAGPAEFIIRNHKTVWDLISYQFVQYDELVLALQSALAKL